MVLEGIASGSINSVVHAITNLPVAQPWLNDFNAFEVNPYISLTPIAVAAQIYLIAAYWRKGSAMAGIAFSALATLLTLLLTSYHHYYHFTWVIPLLTLYFVIADQSPTLFLLIFVGAYLDTLGYSTTNSTFALFQPLFAGIFYGAKAAFLMQTNLHALGITKLRAFGARLALEKTLVRERLVNTHRF